MKLLILAQAVDRQDRLFGFFVPWLEEARSVFSHILVFALRVRTDSIPASIQVIPLKPRGAESRLHTSLRVLTLAWKHRHEYDGVFVRGDAVYLVIAGWLWRLLGKRVVFWYTHYKAGGWMFWIGSLFADRVVTAAASANPLPSATVIGHHIPNSLLQPFHAPATTLRLLMLGRISPVKQVPEMINQLRPLLEQGRVSLTVIGSAPHATDAAILDTLINTLPNISWKREGIPYTSISTVFAEHDALISATPNSLDKVLLEAALGGLFIVTPSTAWKEVLDGTDAKTWGFPTSLEVIPQVIQTYQALPLEAQARLVQQLQDRVQLLHGQTTHLHKLAALFQTLLKP